MTTARSPDIARSRGAHALPAAEAAGSAGWHDAPRVAAQRQMIDDLFGSRAAASRAQLPSSPAVAQRQVIVAEHGAAPLKISDEAAKECLKRVGKTLAKKLAEWIKDGVVDGRSFETWKQLEDRIKQKEEAIDPDTIPPLKYREVHRSIFGRPRGGETFYRAMSDAELEAFTRNRGLSARPRKKDMKQTGQQFISSDFEYSRKIVEESYRKKVVNGKENPLASYRSMIQLDFADESLEYMVSHPRTRVGSGDKKTQSQFDNLLPEQQKNEHDGVIVIKSEPFGKGVDKQRALNIGFTPATAEHDPRRDVNALMVHAEVHGEFAEADRL